MSSSREATSIRRPVFSARLAVLSTLLFASGVLIWMIPEPEEVGSVFEGKTVEEWFAEIEMGGRVVYLDSHKPLAAFRVLHQSAVPFLLNQLTNQESAMTEMAIGAANNVSGKIAGTNALLLRRTHIETSQDRRTIAFSVLFQMEARAKSAAPGLTNILLNSSYEPWLRYNTAHLLANIEGDPAIVGPALELAAKDKDRSVAGASHRAIEQITLEKIRERQKGR